MTKHEMLKTYFGHDEFRTGQEEIIDSILQSRDVLCVMPTGAGKSVCYQIPALMLPGTTLVISPLISLMKDQVNALTQAGIKAAYINSSLTMSQYNKVLDLASDGTYKIIYVAPERLAVDQFLNICTKMKISFIAVDEAHCVSQWGQDFRPSYMRILEFVDALSYRPVIGAFTATATREVKTDISKILRLNNPYAVTTGFDRPNLYFSVIQPLKKADKLLEFMSERQSKSGIIYCSTRKAVEEVCELLIHHDYEATRYHAGLSDRERLENQDDFVFDRKSIMVATNAFGMGIDKSNVSFVVHYNMPKNIESYYQEAGRAGRDGSPSDCVILYSPKDVHTNKFLIDNTKPNPELDSAAQEKIKAKDRERLKYMTFYCTTSECLRAFILRYFGERAQDVCDNCSSCEAGFETVDITVDAQKILSCIARTGQRYGVGMIADILHGSRSDRIISLALDKQSTYGIMAGMQIKAIRRIIDTLVQQQYAGVTESEYPVLTLTEESYDILRRGKQVEMKFPLAAEKTEKKKQKARVADTGLYAELKKLRYELAIEARVPAYVIFTDASLTDMCRKLPQTQEEFLSVSGVGKAKLERYGERFLEVIVQYADSNSVKSDSTNKDTKAEQSSEGAFSGYKQELLDKGMLQAYNPWSEEEDEQLEGEIQDGLTVPQIAENHKRTTGSIQCRIKKLNLIEEEADEQE